VRVGAARTRRRVWPYILAGVGAILAAGVEWAVYFGPESLTTFALQQLERELNRKIDVGRAHLQLLPHPLLQLDDLVVHDRDVSRTLVTAKHVELSLRIFPLLKKKVVAKRLRFEQPRVDLRRDRSGRWNIAAGEQDEPAEDVLIPDPLTMLLWVQETTVVGGTLTLVDEFREDGVRTMQLNGLDASVNVPPRTRHADLRLAATLPSPQAASSLTITGRMTLTDSTVRIGTESPVAQVPTFQFDGSGDLLNVDVRQIAEFLGPRPVPDQLTGSANFRIRFRVVPGVNGYDVVLSDLTANVERVSFSGQGNLSALMSAQPTFSFTLSSSPASLEELLTRFPVQWLPENLQKVVAERALGGTVEVVTASITGSASPEPHVSVTGEFRVTEARALLGERRIPAQHLAGTVFVEPGRTKVTGLSGEYGPMRISAGRATITYPDADTWLDLELDGDMAAVDLITILAGTLESHDIAQALDKLREVTGEASLSYQLAGSLTGGDRVKVVHAEVQPRNVAFLSPGLPDRVTGLSGRIVTTEKGTEFHGTTAQMGQLQMEAQGALVSGEQPQWQGVLLHLKGDTAELVRWYPQIFSAESTPRGTVEGVVSLNGPLTTPQFHSTLDLKDVALSLVEGVGKPAGTPGSLEIEGKMLRNKIASFSHVEFHLPPFRLAGKGSVRIEPLLAVDASLASGPIVLDSLPPGSPLEGFTNGILEVSMDVKGRGPDMKTWQYNGWIALTDGTLAPKGLEAPLSNIYLRTQLVRNSADIKRLALRIKDSDVRLSGTIKNWQTAPRIDVTIESYQFDLDLLIPKGRRSPVRDMLENLAAGSHTAATLTIDRGRYKDLVFTDLNGQVHIRDGAVYVDQVTGETSGGRVDGRLAVRLPRQKPAAVEASFTLNDIPFEKILLLAGDESRMITGGLTATGTMRGNGDDAHGVLASLNGKAAFAIRKGRVQKGTVLPKIIGMLNLPALLAGKVDLSRDGFPFDKITGSVTVKDGLVTEDELIVDSPIVKMSAAGTYDIPSDQLNTVVAVSPFGSYSSALKSIPLFGKIFAGERKGLLTAVFEVRGPAKNPEVTYRPIDSLTTGLGGLAQLAIDVLKNTLTLPLELMSPNGEKPATDGSGAPSSAPRPPEPPVSSVP
jgi:hypothetical protein